MPKLRPHLPLALACMLLAPDAFGCMWDSDTLLQERSRFPGTLELITGKFLRHSREFYEWRIADRLRRLEADPGDLPAYDDLAVAYDKIGEYRKAIDAMLEKDRRRPGLYETEANLGTFLIHSGRLEDGLKHIGRAIEIDPDAHFGREKYQKLLVEYVLDRRRGGRTPRPLAAIGDDGSPDPRTPFTAFLLRGRGERRLGEAERGAALKGVLGMMRFGDHESPVLLEALADLLSGGDGDPQDAKRLSARASLKASFGAEEEARKAYRGTARHVLKVQLGTPILHPVVLTVLTVEELEASFRQELEEAGRWYDAVRRDERAWIEGGEDPEREFLRKYYEEPRVATHWGEGLWAMAEANEAAAAVVTGLALSAVFLLVRGWRRRRELAASTRGRSAPTP